MVIKEDHLVLFVCLVVILHLEIGNDIPTLLSYQKYLSRPGRVVLVLGKHQTVLLVDLLKSFAATTETAICLSETKTCKFP